MICSINLWSRLGGFVYFISMIFAAVSAQYASFAILTQTPTIMFSPWPEPLSNDEKARYGLDERALRDMAGRQLLVIQVRNIRAQYNIPSGKKLKLVFHAPYDIAAEEKAVIGLLVGAESIEYRHDYQPSRGEPVVHPGFGGKLFIPLEGLIDVAAETARLTKEFEKITAEIEKLDQKLNNANFTQKAPPKVLDEHKQRLAEWQSKRDHAKSALEMLKG